MLLLDAYYLIFIQLCTVLPPRHGYYIRGGFKKGGGEGGTKSLN